MNQLCNCKRDKIKEIVKAILLEERSFFNRDARSLENSAEIHTHVIENIVSDIVHKQSCNIGELIKAERENTIVVDTNGSKVMDDSGCRWCHENTHEEDTCEERKKVLARGEDIMFVAAPVDPVLEWKTKIFTPSNSMELKVPVPCKDCMEDLHDWRIWSQSNGETNFVCAKCFWRKTKRAAINPGPGTYGEVFDDVIKPPLKLNLN